VKNSSFQNVPRSRAESRISTDTWVEKIPQHWHAIQLKYLIAAPITDGPHTTPEFTQAGVPFLSVDGIQNGELYFEKTRFISQEDHESFKVKAFPIKGDILMGKAASTGKIARVKVNFEFSIWSPLALIRPNKSLINSGYLEYSLKSIYLQAQIENLCTSSTQKNISMDDIPTLLFLLPPLEVQQRIADFLDAETAQIDALILEKERMLELLEEKRAALISHAVTKGLNPNAPTKDSGLEWLGKIPAHWKLGRAKQFFALREELSEEGQEELLTVSHITGVTSRAEKDVNMFKAEDMTGYKRCQPGDFVINTLWAWMGAMGIAWQEGIVSPAYHVYIPREELQKDYMELLGRSKPFVAEVMRFSKGVWSSRLRLYPESFLDMQIPVPPLEEQTELVAMIQVETKKNAEFKKALDYSLDLLHERRSALITAAVTGQLEVQGVTA
jgi:type I restriction enzyme, S subunit